MTQPLVGKQILIVEDEPVFRSLLDSWFSSLGATTALAGDGVDALELMGRFTPDLMICDIAMPRMNGLKLVENLRNRGDQTPILVISATENMADIAKALRLGVEDVLLKPVKDLNRLRETVFACLYPNMFNSRVEEEERLVVCGMTKRKSERKLLYRPFPTSVTICGRFISICLNYTNISPFWT